MKDLFTCMTFEVLAAVASNIKVFLDVSSCFLAKICCNFREKYFVGVRYREVRIL
jgi:hypothetical protein